MGKLHMTRGRVIRAGVAAAAAATALAGSLATSMGAQAAVGSPTANGPANPYAPSFGHPYRHGAVPTRGAKAKMAAYRAQHPLARAAASQNLHYGAGADGIGVTTGAPKVYLVFWGLGWGPSQTSDTGEITFLNDSPSTANDLQEMYKDLGTNHEEWSGVMTQYCEGVPTGETACPPGAPKVGYPLSGALAGAWYDDIPVPVTTTAHQIAAEAVSAAGHFGNTTAAANRNAQYVIFSPHNYHPDGWSSSSGFCAWHDWNGDTNLDGGGAVPSPYGDIAFTNMPYVLDAGTNCGESLVNTDPGTGTLDGVSIVAGHEYAETITDPIPAGGWTDANGDENADKCAWLPPGVQGGAADITLGFAQFAEQSTWSNAAGVCVQSGHLITVTNPGTQTGEVGDPAGQNFSASGGYPGYTWSASGLPPGLSMDASSGTVSGTPAAAGNFTTTAIATDTQGFRGFATFSWSIIPAQGTVPDVTGMQLADAESALQAAGFVPGQVSFFRDPTCTRIGLVTDQNPAGGTVDALGASVNLTVGRMPPPPFQCQ